MLLERLDFTLELECLSDLHIGTGEEVLISELRKGTEGSSDSKGLASKASTVIRNATGNPVISPTALKGALAKALGEERARDVFGQARGSADAAMGKVLFFAGDLIDCPTDASFRLPHWDSEAATFIATHTAITKSRGTVEEHKLFNIEYAPSGSLFAVHGTYWGSRPSAEKDLGEILGLLTTEEGLNVGAGEANGYGRVRLKSNALLCKHVWFDGSKGAFETAENVRIAPLDVDRRLPVREVKMMLSCDGPYMSADPSASRENKNPALRRNDTQPVLWPDSLRGALRSRLAWLGQFEQPVIEDNPFRKKAPKNPKELTAIERLFGATGWRGLVRIVRAEPVAGQPAGLKEFTGIAIDRLSGANIDGALFAHETFVGARFEIAIALESRVFHDGEDYPLEADLKIFEVLMSDLKADPVLMLGHGTNRGFGWFEVDFPNKEGG